MTTTYGYDDAGAQAVMILDHPRTAAYAEAIWQLVGDDDVVLDVGSGSGVLALLAAQAGAKKVYAVERSAMAEVIRENARANGFEDRIEVIRKPLEELEPGALAEPATVILSEMLGYFAPDEHGHRLYRLASRHSIPKPRLIPGSYSVVLSVANVRSLTDELALLEDCHGVRLTGVAQRLRSRPVTTEITPEEQLSKETSSGSHSFADVRPELYEATVEGTEDGWANAVVASFDAELAPGVILSTGPSAERIHWHQLAFPMFPELRVRKGSVITIRVRPRLVSAHSTWVWSAECDGETRGGDAMNALTAAKGSELGIQLGMRIEGPIPFKETRSLQAFGAVLAGGLGGSDVDALTKKLMKAMPAEFPDRLDARDEVLALLEAAGSLGANEP